MDNIHPFDDTRAPQRFGAYEPADMWNRPYTAPKRSRLALFLWSALAVAVILTTVLYVMGMR